MPFVFTDKSICLSTKWEGLISRAICPDNVLKRDPTKFTFLFDSATTKKEKQQHKYI